MRKSLQFRFQTGLIILVLLNSLLCPMARAIRFKATDEKIDIGAHVYTFQSKVNGTAYKLFINTPANYNPSSTNRYPVIYLLDAQWDHKNMVSGYGNLYYDGFVPEMVIVGISYDGDNPNYGALRAYDFTPNHWEERGKTGGAPDFLRMLRTELFPFIEESFHADPEQRMISGTSYGGLFATYALFTDPELFKGYMICNPAWRWKDDWVAQQEFTYARQHKQLSAAVYLAMAEYDNVQTFNRITDQIRSRNYSGLRLKSRIQDSMGHSSCKSEAFVRGLHFLFNRPTPKLAAEELTPYTGTYELSSDKTLIQIQAGDGCLVIKNLWTFPETKLYGLENGHFSWQNTYTISSFSRNEDGNVTNLTLALNRGKPKMARKITD